MVQNRGLSLLLRKSSEVEDETSNWVLEKALTLLDLRSGAFLGELSVDCRTDACPVEEEEVDAKLVLLEEDLKAETAIFSLLLATFFVVFFCLILSLEIYKTKKKWKTEIMES